MDGAELSALVGIFADAIQIAEDVAPVLTPGTDGATAGAIGMSVSRRVGDVISRLERVPSIEGVPPEVLGHLKELARIVRSTRTECVAYGDVALYLARSNLRAVARDGWQAIVRSRPENQGLLAWADEGASSRETKAEGIARFIERLLAGPEDVELSPRELALLDAHLRAKRSLAEMARAAEPNTVEGRNRRKLELIYNFNRNLQRSVAEADKVLNDSESIAANSKTDAAAVDAITIVPTLDEIRAKVQATRERTRHPNASHNPSRMAADAYNDYATIVRMLEKCGIAARPLPDHRLHPLQTMNYVLLALDDVELALDRASAPAGATTRPAEPQPTADPAAGIPSKTARSPALDAATGFLGGATLADALGVHATRRDAFFRRLERQRISLGDDCWHEVRDPRPNSPRFLYRADSTTVRNLADAYKNPKSA